MEQFFVLLLTGKLCCCVLKIPQVLENITNQRISALIVSTSLVMILSLEATSQIFEMIQTLTVLSYYEISKDLLLYTRIFCSYFQDNSISLNEWLQKLQMVAAKWLQKQRK